MPNQEVVVIGAGLAGLTAAVHLAERDVPVLVLEADARVAGGRFWGGGPHSSPPAPPSSPVLRSGEEGGVARSAGAGGEVSLDGFTFYPEHGVHGLWNEYHNLRAVLERFGLAPEIVLAEEEEWIHGEGARVLRAEIGSGIRDSALPAPLHYLDLFTRPSFMRVLGWRDWLGLPAVWYGLLMAVALDPFARHIALPGQTLAEFGKHWSPRIGALLGGLARNSLATRAEETPLASFIAFLRFYTLLRRDAWRYCYFTTDPGTAIITPLLERIRARGGEVLLGATADDIAPHPLSPLSGGERGLGEGWRVRFQTRSGPRVFYAAHVILATDAPAAQRLLCESPATQPMAQSLTWPTGQPNAAVRLWFNAVPRPGPEGGIFTGDFAMDNFFWLHRLQNDFGAWARATGGSAIEMHIYGPADFLAQPEAVILARVLTDFYRAHPELRGHLRHQVLQRNAATHSKMIVDAPERWLGVPTPWPNLWACGDWVRGEWPALFLERACVSGVAAANEVLGAMGREPFVVRAYAEPEWLAARLQMWMLRGRALFKRWRKR